MRAKPISGCLTAAQAGEGRVHLLSMGRDGDEDLIQATSKTMPTQGMVITSKASCSFPVFLKKRRKRPLQPRRAVKLAQIADFDAGTNGRCNRSVPFLFRQGRLEDRRR